MFGLTYDLSPKGFSGKTALVMLPGAGMCGQDFREHSFIHELHERGRDIDVVTVDISLEDYVLKECGRRLHSEVYEQVRERGYRHIWFVGISLGAYGALRLLQEGGVEIAGLLLLSPFLATRGTVARVSSAGGLDGWSPHPVERDNEEMALLCWLKDNLTIDRTSPRIYLGCGMQDRYASASELLANRLPSDRVFRTTGDHDWSTWLSLWREMLDVMPMGFDIYSRNG